MKSSLGTILAFTAALSGPGCKEELTTEICEEIAPGSRPVEGACLDSHYDTVDQLRDSCRERITVKQEEGCPCEGMRGFVWRCVERETAPPDED